MEEEGSDEKLSNLQQFVKETLTKKTGNPTPSLGFTFVPRVINLSHFPPTLITVLVCLTAARDEFLSWKKAKKKHPLNLPISCFCLVFQQDGVKIS